MNSHFRAPRRPASVWPELLVGVGAAAAVVLEAVHSILSLDPEANLGIPAQVALAVAYCLTVGALCGLVVGLSLHAVSRLFGRTQSTSWIRILMATLVVVLVGAVLAWMVPIFHSTEPLRTLPFFLSGAGLVVAIEIVRNFYMSSGALVTREEESDDR